jgi:hypothetical protein
MILLQIFLSRAFFHHVSTFNNFTSFKDIYLLYKIKWVIIIVLFSRHALNAAWSQHFCTCRPAKHCVNSDVGFVTVNGQFVPTWHYWSSHKLVQLIQLLQRPLSGSLARNESNMLCVIVFQKYGYAPEQVTCITSYSFIVIWCSFECLQVSSVISKLINKLPHVTTIKVKI